MGTELVSRSPAQACSGFQDRRRSLPHGSWERLQHAPLIFFRFVVGSGAMDKFSAESLCPKCGGHAGCRYNRALEMIERSCACGYSWHERPLDWKDPTDENG
jgi:hypothetical protein